MHRTPWTASGSLPSDKLQPKKSNKQKPTATTNQEKSKPVRELETLISKLSSSSTTPDPKGGCFCLAREHPLSEYTPSCRSCGFILCNLNQPYHICPSCSTPLLTPPQSTSLISTLQSRLTQTLENEEKERVQLIEEAKRAQGAFPTLSVSPSSPNLRVSQPQLRPAHKVLSLTSSGSSGSRKLVIVSHHTTPTSSRPASRGGSGTSTPQVHNEVRVPPPPSTIDYAIGQRVDKDRPWKNLIVGGEVKYIPPLKEEKGDPGMSRNQRRKANQRARERNESVVGASAS
ncbi:hypothetical protein AN958_11723 [Leucoagaricus sp. SymC.cos]|nr:hypothetical protein AN958_11723 [Leucoagaricus sp. SymC.cos]